MSELPKCAQLCKQTKTECPNGDCRKWIDYEKDYNCCLISIEEKGKDGNDKGLTLHEVADRLGINYLKVRQIEINALKKLAKKNQLKQFVE